MKPAILASAACLVLAHNHPSGCPEPSTATLGSQRLSIYIYGEMGIRHEDVIFITETGAEGVTKWTGTPEAPAAI